MNDKKLQKSFAILGVFDYISDINQNGEIMKGRTPKYYKREGTPGNYKYYYTKEEYQQAKSKKQSSKTFGPQITEKRLQEGTPENEAYRKQLQDSAKWNKKVKQQEEEARKEKKQKVYDVEWTKVEGVDVKRIGGSNFVAAPVSGKKNSRRFDIIDLNDRSDIVTQVSKEEVNQWLISKRKIEEENK